MSHTDPTPGTTAIKRSRVGNVTSGRLARRHQHLLDSVIGNGSRHLPTRNMHCMRAAELCVVEAELIRRGHLTQRQAMAMRAHAAQRVAQ